MIRPKVNIFKETNANNSEEEDILDRQFKNGYKSAQALLKDWGL
jgi:hypothetical protein